MPMANQPSIAQWNIARLAEALLPLIDEDTNAAIEQATGVIQGFSKEYQKYWLKGMCAKIGLSTQEEGDLDLIDSLLNTMAEQNIDFCTLFRGLSSALSKNNSSVKNLFRVPEKFEEWCNRWLTRLARESLSQDARAQSMNSVNPVYIARNHKVEEALQAAEEDANFMPFNKLLAVLTHPFEEREGLTEYAEPAPQSAPPYRTFCGT